MATRQELEKQSAATVLAHIAAHKVRGETAAYEAHMKIPGHKAIVEAANAATTEVGSMAIGAIKVDGVPVEFEELKTSEKAPAVLPETLEGLAASDGTGAPAAPAAPVEEGPGE